MAKIKYKYNPNTLSYEKIQLTIKDWVRKFFSYFLVGLLFAGAILLVAYSFIESPKELNLQRENKQLRQQYALLNRDLQRLDQVLSNIEQRDDNVYRQIMEAEPISQNVRAAGVGGVNRYRHLEGYANSELIIQTNQRIDKLAKRMYVQSKSFDEVVELAKKKADLLASIPAIQPVKNEEMKRMASGFGMRIHPIYKVPKMHAGLDFSAPEGTEIFATGDGKVVEVKNERTGYGRHVVIDHGYGYQTLYAHMSKSNVRVGQRLKRGDVIGAVGNTGLSSAPHLHYEVIKDDVKIDPANFFFNDLTPAEYDMMIQLSSTPNQSFD